MTRLWQRLAGANSRRDEASTYGLQQWADILAGLGDVEMQTTMGTLTEEHVPITHGDGYRRSSPIFSLIAARMQAFSQARFQWTRFEGGKPTELFGSTDLAILEQPWLGGTTPDLLARMELHVSVAGNAYVCHGRNRLHMLYPQWMWIILGSNTDEDTPATAWDAEIIGYAYRPPGAAMKLFLPDEIAHYAPLPDPDANYLGMSWISPVVRDMRADGLMTEHKSAFMKNAATPNLAVKFDPSIGPEKAAAFKELMEAEHRGAFNAYKTLYLGGGADATVIGADFKQMDFVASQGKGESRMASAAGVPPSWVGFSEGLQGSSLNAGNFTSARRRFSDGTMAHLWSNAAASLQILVQEAATAKGASLWYDLSSAPFMREDAKDLSAIQGSQASTLMSLVNSGFTPASAIDAVINNDWARLKHTGLTSVQLLPPSDGKEPVAATQTDGGAPGVTPPTASPKPATAGSSPSPETTVKEVTT